MNKYIQYFARQKLTFIALGLVVVVFAAAYFLSTDSGKKMLGIEIDPLASNASLNKFSEACTEPASAINGQSRYIVSLNNSSGILRRFGFGSSINPDETANRLIAQYGGQKKEVFTSALKGFVVEITPEAARSLSTDSSVTFVEEDCVVTLSSTQLNPPSWGLDRIDQLSLPLSGSYVYDDTATGAGVNVYIIDSGLRPTHTDFEGRAFSTINTTDDGLGTDDCHGHGTHVAGTVGGRTFGVAKGVRLYGVKVFSCSNTGWLSDIIEGVDWVSASRISPSIVNMSLATLQSETLDNAVRGLINSGTPVVVAAGNTHPNMNACFVSPARVAEAITVGATNINDAWGGFLNGYPNGGPCVDLSAPGTNIVSAYFRSDSDVANMQGTSMATPHVTGAMAILMQKNPGASPEALTDLLMGAAAHKVTGQLPPGTTDLLLYSPSTAGAPCTHIAPTVSVDPVNSYVGVGQTITVDLTLRNNDANTCPNSAYRVEPVGVPVGWQIDPPSSDTGIIFPGGAPAHSTFSITPPPGTSSDYPYYQTLQFKGTKVGDTTISATAEANFTVTGPISSSSPDVTILTPANNAVMPDRMLVKTQAEISGELIGTMTIQVDGYTVQTCSPMSYGFADCAVTVNGTHYSAGSHTITVTATTHPGGQTGSATVYVVRPTTTGPVPRR